MTVALFAVQFSNFPTTNDITYRGKSNINTYSVTMCYLGCMAKQGFDQVVLTVAVISTRNC